MTPEGSLFMATVNDDAAGVYACTPHNSFGSMGPSGATNVRLQVSVQSRVWRYFTLFKGTVQQTVKMLASTHS